MKKILYLDALRGVAILMVVAVHVSQWAKPDTKLLLALTSKGGLGVQLFFILSAFTLCYATEKKGIENLQLFKFYSRRFFRIAPLFYFGIVVYTFYQGLGASYYAPEGKSISDIVLTFFFLHGWKYDTINSVVPGGWSIANEIMFYAIFPFLLKFLRNFNTGLVILLFTIVLKEMVKFGVLKIFGPHVEFYLTNSFFQYWFFEQLPIFIMGMLLYYKIGAIDKNSSLLKTVVPLLLFLIFISFGLIANHFAYYNMMIYSISISFLFLIKIFQGLTTGNKLERVLAYLGKISFSVYIIHFVVIYVLQNFINGPKFIYAFSLVLAISSTIAVVTYNFIEKPGMKLEGKFSALLGKRVFGNNILGNFISPKVKKFLFVQYIWSNYNKKK